MPESKAEYQRHLILDRYQTKDVFEILSEIHGERFRDYRRKWEQSCAGPVESPEVLEVGFQLTNVCNLRCPMCPTAMIPTKDSKFMSIETVEKVLDDLGGNVPCVKISYGAEGMLHPQFTDFISLFARRGVMDISVITNGTRMGKEIAQVLINEKVARLNVSLDAVTPGTYRKVRGGNLSVVERNIHRLLDMREQQGAVLPLLRVSFIKQDSNLTEMDLFLKKWSGVADFVDFQDLIDFSNIGDLKPVDVERNFYCPHPFQRLRVDVYGNIYPCSTFYQVHHHLGNLSDIPVGHAWNCSKIEQLRNDIAENRPPLACQNCYGRLKNTSVRPTTTYDG